MAKTVRAERAVRVELRGLPALRKDNIHHGHALPLPSTPHRSFLLLLHLPERCPARRRLRGGKLPRMCCIGVGHCGHERDNTLMGSIQRKALSPSLVMHRPLIRCAIKDDRKQF